MSFPQKMVIFHSLVCLFTKGWMGFQHRITGVGCNNRDLSNLWRPVILKLQGKDEWIDTLAVVQPYCTYIIIHFLCFFDMLYMILNIYHDMLDVYSISAQQHKGPMFLEGRPFGQPLGSSTSDGAHGHEPAITGRLPGRLARRRSGRARGHGNI